MNKPEIAELGTPNSQPQLYDNENRVPLEGDETAVSVHIETTPDGGYSGNHFGIGIGTKFRLIGFDKSEVGRERWIYEAWVNSTDLREYLESAVTEKPSTPNVAAKG